MSAFDPILSRRHLLRVGAVSTAVSLSGCGGIARLGCDRIAEEARRMSQERPIKIESIANVHETARSDTEVRCTGDATRPNFIYGQLTGAALDFSPETGIGGSAAPFNGTLPATPGSQLAFDSSDLKQRHCDASLIAHCLAKRQRLIQIVKRFVVLAESAIDSAEMN